MAAHRSEQRLLHRRLANAYPEIAPRRFCLPGERHCNQVAPTDGAAASPTDDPSTYDWLTFLYPQGTTSTPSIPAVQTPSTTSTTTSVIATSLTSSTTRSTSTTTHHKSTSTGPRSQTAAGAQSSSSSAPQSGSTSTGAVVGGVAGGVIGLALLLSLIAFIMRRLRRRRERPQDFNSADFRKSAVLLDDPPTHEDTVIAGFNPRPPLNMVENRPPTFGTMYGPASYNYGQFVANSSPVTAAYPYSPNTPSVNSANPFVATAPYTPNPFSPLSSPVADSHVTPQGLTRSTSASTAGPATLSRQGSGRTVTGGAPQYATYPSTVSDSAPMPSSDYVDLSRSSVSPFQAAQYAEISQRIGSDVPTGLSSPAVEDHMQNLRAVPDSDDVPPPPPEKNLSSGEESATLRLSAATDHSDVLDTREMDFPVPPSPSLTSVSRYNRVDSTPPSLPEIRVESRASFATSTLNQLSPFGTYDFPSPAFSSAYASGTSSVPQIITVPPKSHLASQGAFPVTPSPLNSSFSPSVDGSFDSAPPSPKPAPVNHRETKHRPDTLYDPEDAYGGI